MGGTGGYRKELAVSQRECEEVGSRLRHREAQAEAAAKRGGGGAPRVGGLCLKCAQHEAVMAETHANVHMQAVERLTKSVTHSPPPPTHTHVHHTHFYIYIHILGIRQTLLSKATYICCC